MTTARWLTRAYHFIVERRHEQRFAAQRIRRIRKFPTPTKGPTP